MGSEKNINSYLAVFFGVLVLGLLVHQDRTFAGSALGHGLGIAGGILILMTLIYPFRKRILKKKGKQNPINSHITYGVAGASLAVIHSAHKLESLIGILIFLSLVTVILSGIVGRYLFKTVNRSLKQQKRDNKLLQNRIENRQKELRNALNADEASGAWQEADLPEMTDDWGRWLEEIHALAETEYNMKFFDRLKALFTKWLRIHYAISALLFALVIVHVITTLYYGLRWLQ